MGDEKEGPAAYDDGRSDGHSGGVGAQYCATHASRSNSHRVLLCFLIILALAPTGCWTKRLTDREQFDNEINIRRKDPKTGMPNWIEVRPDVKVSIGDFWKRYEAFFRIPPSALRQGPTRRDRLGSGNLTSFQQVHLGYPVANGGYVVETEHNLVRNAMGSFIVGLPASLPPPRIGRSAALHIAITSLKLQGPPPWTVTKSAGYHPPEATLSLAPWGVDGRYKLLWYVDFAGTGVGRPDVGGFVVDAVNGAIIGKMAGDIR
jgi:hypothetical protein